eukprot:1119809-Pelagomonas_calceolata.AAC.1
MEVKPSARRCACSACQTLPAAFDITEDMQIRKAEHIMDKRKGNTLPAKSPHALQGLQALQ